MRSTDTLGVTLALALGFIALPACGPIAFQDTVNLGAPVVAVEAPPEKPSRVHLTEDHIILDEKIHFEYDKATIQEDSYSLLDEVVALLRGTSSATPANMKNSTSSSTWATA